MVFTLQLLHGANKNTGHEFKFELWLNNEGIFEYKYVPNITQDILVLKTKSFVVYLKLKYNEVFYILSGNSAPSHSLLFGKSDL